jgi:hypothetical protein
MLVNVTGKTYRESFETDPHPFISERFIETNKHKVDEVVRLVAEHEKVAMGLVGGIIENTLKSPISAPFGGFHFLSNQIYTGEIDRFTDLLKSYIVERGLKKVEIKLPPDIYNLSFNAKTVNSLLRGGFLMSIPEITQWVDLEHFAGVYSSGSARTKYNQAIKNGLSFSAISDSESKQCAYELIRQNRIDFNRPIYMTYDELEEVNKLWPVDYFQVADRADKMVASAILYRGHKKIIQAIFWADNESGRSLRAMDFCLINLWNHYKKLGYNFIDIGISTEYGIPNEGLIRFKETHEAFSSARFSFSWSPE